MSNITIKRLQHLIDNDTRLQKYRIPHDDSMENYNSHFIINVPATIRNLDEYAINKLLNRIKDEDFYITNIIVSSDWSRDNYLLGVFVFDYQAALRDPNCSAIRALFNLKLKQLDLL